MKSTFDVVGRLAPDLAFRVLKELTVKELVGVRGVRAGSFMVSRFVFHFRLVGVATLADNGGTSRSVALSLSSYHGQRSYTRQASFGA